MGFCSNFNLPPKGGGGTCRFPPALLVCCRFPCQMGLPDIAEVLCCNAVVLQQSCQPCGFFKSWRNIVNAVKLCLSPNSRYPVLRPFSRFGPGNNVVNHLLYTPLSSSGRFFPYFVPCHSSSGRSNARHKGSPRPPSHKILRNPFYAQKRVRHVKSCRTGSKNFPADGLASAGTNYFIKAVSISEHASSMQPGQLRRILPSAMPLSSRHR